MYFAYAVAVVEHVSEIFDPSASTEEADTSANYMSVWAKAVAAMEKRDGEESAERTVYKVIPSGSAGYPMPGLVRKVVVSNQDKAKKEEEKTPFIRSKKSDDSY